MDKRGRIYVRSLVVADAAGVHLDTLSRLIYEGKLEADAHIEWGTDKVTGDTKYRPIFLRSRVPEVVEIVRKYVRTYTVLTRRTVAIDAEINATSDGE
jgi:hypothetical protein